MQIGVFSRMFEGSSLTKILGDVTGHGLKTVQFNLSCAGLPDMPDSLTDAQALAIREQMEAAGVGMAGVSGTFNMIHPDFSERAAGLIGLRTLIEQCHNLGTSVITLCTGTRDTESMWRRHPDNDSPEAWSDLVRSLCEVLPLAEEKGVSLAFEPEVNNVIDSAQKARRIIDELGSPSLKVCMDGANVFHAGELPRMREILDEAFDLLGADIVLAHAKDLNHDGDAGHEAAGHGQLDYEQYLSLFQKVGYDGPIILHSLSIAQIPECVDFLKRKMPG